VAGIFATLTNLAFVVGPPLGGVLVTLFGAAKMFRVIGAVLLCLGLGAGLAELMRQTKQRNRKMDYGQGASSERQ